MKLVLLALTLTIRSIVYSMDCGVYGTVSDRIHDCKKHESTVEDLDIISIIGDETFYYDKKSDWIISPRYKINDLKTCPKKYSKAPKALRKKLKDEKNHIRCILKKASRYVLVQDEFGL